MPDPTLGCCSAAYGPHKDVFAVKQESEETTRPDAAQRLTLTVKDTQRDCLTLDDDDLHVLVVNVLKARPKVLDRVVSSMGSLQGPIVNLTSVGAFEKDTADTDTQNRPSMKGASIQKIPSEPVTPAVTSAYVKKMKTLSGHFDDEEQQMLRWRKQLHETFIARDMERHGKPPRDLPSVVQFDSSVYYCNENDPTVEVFIIRIGAPDTRVSIDYATQDASAKAGVKYTAVSGTVTFEPGEIKKSIHVPTTDDDSWDAVLEFLVVLSQPCNCALGRYLWTCRIKIIDDDCFPTNKYRDKVLADQIDKINKPGLLLEYFKMNMRNSVVRRGTLKTILADEFDNIYFLLTLFLNLYLVDKVLCDECPRDGAIWSLLMVVALRIAPFPIVHWLDYRQVFWRVGGTSRLTLQANLLRKFLNYNEKSRGLISESKLIMALSRDAAELVQEGFLKLAPLCAALMRVVLIFAYQLITPLIMNPEESASTSDIVQRFVPILLFPSCMLMFLCLRNSTTLRYLEEQKECQNDMAYFVRQTLASFDLMRDYRKRSQAVDHFEVKIREYNAALVNINAVVKNNKMFAPWLTLIVSVIYTMYGGFVLTQGYGLTLGQFLNNLAIYNAYGQMWGKVYDLLLDMQNTFDALGALVKYMNLPMDVEHRYAQATRNRHMWLKTPPLAVEQLKSGHNGVDCVDLMDIELANLSFSYSTEGFADAGLKTSSAVLPQGGLYTLVGPPSEGKGTILKLLGEVLLPFVEDIGACYDGSGSLLMPTHLRCLHVSRDPMFVQGTLLYNLTFGVAKGGEDGQLERVLEICKMMQISPHILECIKADEMVAPWGVMLSSTENALLHVARALIANPEILVIHKPTLFLNTELGDNAYEVLKNFVLERGLCLDPDMFYLRRPRTCVVTARRVSGKGAEVADTVFHVSSKNGMVLMDV